MWYLTRQFFQKFLEISITMSYKMQSLIYLYIGILQMCHYLLLYIQYVAFESFEEKFSMEEYFLVRIFMEANLL